MCAWLFRISAAHTFVPKMSFCISVPLKRPVAANAIHLLVMLILASYDPVNLICADNHDVPAQLLSIPNDGSNREVLIANAMNTSTPILRSDDGSYAWQFAPYQNNKTRLLTIINTAYNRTIIWIANRNHPVSPNASLFLQLPSCIFRLRDGNGSIAWSPPVDDIRTVFINSTGNLIMYNAHNAIIWQSFDNACDLLVPGQMIKTNHRLVSSLSVDDVSDGRYTLHMEPGGVVLYASFDWQQHMVPYVAQPYVRGIDVFSSAQVQKSLHSACNHTNLIYKMGGTSFALQQEGSTITPQCRAEVGGIADDAHALELGTQYAGSTSGLRFIRLMPNGDISTFLSTNSSVVLDKQLFGDLLMSFCRLPSYCGINSLCNSRDNCTCPNMFEPISSRINIGCQLIQPFSCSKSSQHEFLAVPGLDYFANAYLDADTVSSADECQSLCRANCSCTAAFYRNDTRKCHLYDQVQTMLPVSDQSITAYLRVAKLPITDPPGSGNISKKVIIGVTTGIAMIVAIFALFLGWIGRRIMNKESEESDSEEEAFLESLPGLPPRFTYKELHSATEGFSKRLGTGGSGSVYEGHILPADQLHRNNKQLTMNTAVQQDCLLKVAVKELDLSRFPSIAASGKKQFRAEVATLGSLNHVNLVQLRGFCAEGAHRLLIYEFVENGSLDRWIFNNVTPLQWEVRYGIAVDTARGLAFLHEASRDKVVHLDVKPQNILVDSNFRAKLADFGLCKLVGREAERGDGGGGAGESQTVTAMRGTPGYMAPEWFLNLPVTDRSDVFSYGMVLLELVGGRKNLNLAAGSAEDWYVPAWAVRQAEGGNLMDVIDKKLLTQHDAMDQSTSAMCVAMSRLVQVAFWCIQENAGSRPSMGTVLLMLEEHVQVPDPPLDQTYILGRQTQPPVTSTSTSTSTTSSTPASATISELEPR